MRSAARFLLTTALFLLVGAGGSTDGAPEREWQPSLALFQFIASWEGPQEKLADWEDMRSVPRPPKDAPRAEASAASPTWERLAESERQTLEPFRAEWDKLAPQLRELARSGAGHWNRFDPQQRTMWFARHDRWLQVSETDRADLLARFAWWNRLSDEERQAARSTASAEAVAKPAAEEKVKKPHERRRRSGSGRNREGRVREWVEQLPPEQREQVVQRLRSMPREERRGLRNKLRSLSKEERTRVLQEMLKP